MSKFLTDAQAEAFENADVENLVPAGEYIVEIMSVEPQEHDADIHVFKFEITSGEFTGRQLRAWPSTELEKIWTLKKLIGEVVVDAASLQLEDLEGHVFKAEVSVEKRKDNGEKTNRVLRLHSWDGDGTGDDEENLGGL